MGAVITAPLILVLLHLGLRWYVDHRPDLRDPIYYAKEDLLVARFTPEDPDRITIVALGSSRTGNSFHPPTVEAEVTAVTGRPCRAFNTSLPGGGPVTQLLHIRRLTERGIKPDLVVVEIIPSMCAKRDGTPPEMGHLRPDRVTRKELADLDAIGFTNEKYHRDWLEAELNPWFGFRFQILGLIQPKWTPPGVVKSARTFPNPTGWHPWLEPITPESYRKHLAVARIEHFENLQTIEVSEIALRAYAEIFATCRENGIVAVAVITPEGSDFRAWYGAKAHKATAILLEAARSGTGGNVVDAREWLPDSAFADGHHVSQKDAADFTKRLTRDALVPALRSSPYRRAPE